MSQKGLNRWKTDQKEKTARQQSEEQQNQKKYSKYLTIQISVFNQSTVTF